MTRWLSSDAPIRLALLLASAVSAAGCSGQPPTNPSPAVVMTTSIFSDTLAVGETRFHAFPTAASSSAQATLASLTNATGDLVAAPVTLAIGTPTDSGCTPISTTAAAHPALVSQVSATVSPGLYCVSVGDSGSLRESVNYSVRVVHP